MKNEIHRHPDTGDFMCVDCAQAADLKDVVVVFSSSGIECGGCGARYAGRRVLNRPAFDWSRAPLGVEAMAAAVGDERPRHA